MEAKLNDSKIILPIGTEISLKMRGKSRKSSEVKLINSEEESKFYALFTENDVDFEIEINNAKCNNGIGYTLALNDGYYDYYVGPREVWVMEALYSNGRKLHFISQNTDEGKVLVAETADLHQISYGDAAAICCKIEFTFEIEKEAEKPKQKARPQVSTRLARLEVSRGYSEDCIDESHLSRAFYSQPETLCAKSSPTISSRISGALSGLRSLGSRSHCKMTHSAALGSNISACSRILAEEPSPPPPPMADLSFAVCAEPPADFDLEVTDRVMSGGIHSLAKPFPSSAIKAVPVVSKDGDGENTPEGGGGDLIGEKGVICFGDTSDQIYSAFGGFVKDKSLEIKPFVIEMRMSGKN
jgi:hypothetical protein